MKSLASLWFIFSQCERRNYIFIQAFFVVNSALEVAMIFVTAPFFAYLLAGESSFLEPFIETLPSVFPSGNFIPVAAVVIAILVVLSSVSNIMAHWTLIKFSNDLGVSVCRKLLKSYLTQDFESFISSDSSRLINTATIEITRITNRVVAQSLLFSCKAISVIAISCALIVFDSKFAIIGGLVLFSVYAFMFLLSHRFIAAQGREVSASASVRAHIISEAINNFVDIKLKNCHDFFLEKYEREGKRYAKAMAISASSATVPRYMLEGLSVVMALVMVFYLTGWSGQTASDNITTIGIIGMAALKIIPSLQGVYQSLMVMSGNLGAVESLLTEISQSSGNGGRYND